MVKRTRVSGVAKIMPYRRTNGSAIHVTGFDVRHDQYKLKEGV